MKKQVLSTTVYTVRKRQAIT